MESRTMKILMIDDNQDNLTILKTLILESFPDASVLSALNGQRGLELAASEEPDIILLDIIMPGLDGYEVCRKLKDDAKLCDIPVVFVTAIRSNKESRIRALECGAEAFLTKPIDDIELTAQIRAMFKIRTANIRKRDDKRMLAALVNEKTKELKDANAKLLKTVGDLKNEQALLDAIFDSIPGYLYLYDERGKLVKWNKKHETMTGYSTEELADMSLNKWFDQEDIQKVNAAVKDIFETGYGEVEAQLILKSGAKMLVRSSGVPLVLNGQKYFAGIGMNITEQKRVEKALLESQRIAHLGTWSLDLLTNQVVWSEELYKMYGFDPSLPPPPYTEHMKLFTPESWIELSTALEHARTTGIPYELELKTVTADGSNGWMWVRGEAKTDSSGKIVALWGAAQDITARKQAEETLQESEEANKLLLDHLHVGIVLHNPDSSISFCNPLASELLGLSTNQMQSKLVSDKAWCFYNRLGEPLSAELYPFSLVYRDKELINYEMGILQEREKGIKWILVNGFAIPDKAGNLEKILISFIDITDKKQSEEAALVNSVKFQSLFDEMTSGAAIYDVLNNGATGADYIIKDFNKVALKAEGKEKREVLGKSLCELRPNIDQYGLIPVFQKVWQTGQPAYYPSKIYIDEKFSNWYENHVYKLLSGEIVAIFDDVTEKKHAEKNIQYLAYHDHLTDTYNRRFFESEYNAKNTDEYYPLAIVTGDLNGLKLINDSFGHFSGDTAIKQFANEIKKHIPDDAILARVGGDEFSVILTRCSDEEARLLTSELQSNIRFNIKDNNGNIVEAELTATFGYSSQSLPGQGLDDLVKEAETFMYRRKFLESTSKRSNVVGAIMSALFEKSEREQKHSLRVSGIATAIAIAMDLHETIVAKVRVAGALHDIGKIGIDESILNKVERLSDKEWELLRQHPIRSARILASVDEYLDIVPIVKAHHERIDGSGYPAGLSGKQIPIEAKIIAVADSFDAMTVKRPYRDAISKKLAADELKLCAGSQFDQEVVDTFIKKVLPTIDSLMTKAQADH